MSISKLGQHGQVVISKDIREALNLEKGDLIDVRQNRGTVVIRPQKPLDPEDSFTPEEEESISKGFRQLRQGEWVNWEDLKQSVGL